MIYAYRRTESGIDLYASEANKLPPADFRICSLDGYMAAWQLKDKLAFAQLRGAPGNPYEAQS